MDRDGYISNGELFLVLKMMVGNNLKDTQLQQIVDKTIINADKDGDGKINYEGNLKTKIKIYLILLLSIYNFDGCFKEFCAVVGDALSTDIHQKMTVQI